MEYNWENIFKRCEDYVTKCRSELPENFEDRLINDVYNHLLIDRNNKRFEEQQKKLYPKQERN